MRNDPLAINNANTIPPGDHTRTANSNTNGVVLYIKPPVNLYNGTNYTYHLRFDLRRPTGQYFAPEGWHEQDWTISIANKPPTPAPTSPCASSQCSTPQSTVPVGWTMPTNPDPVTYLWRQTTPTGQLTGEIATPSVNITLVEGLNTLFVKARDTTPLKTVGDEVVVGQFFYDPTPPTLNVAPLATWSKESAITLSWQGQDFQSGIADYTVEQQINGGTWTTLIASTQTSSYQVTTLINNTTYTFRVTARDKAGNQTQQTRSITIDRDPPSSSLNAPMGQIAKTWTILRWTSSYDRAPITSFAIDRYIGTTWQPLYAGIGPGDRRLFEGVANTTYALRIRATDAAGNVEFAAVSPQITFTTGSDPTGLFRHRLPILLSNSAPTTTTSPDTGSSSPTTAYPLPQP